MVSTTLRIVICGIPVLRVERQMIDDDQEEECEEEATQLSLGFTFGNELTDEDAEYDAKQSKR